MKYLPLVLILILASFPVPELLGQAGGRQKTDSWNFTGSYSPGYAFAFSDSLNEADRNLYYSGYHFGMNKRTSKQMFYSFGLDFKHKREVFPYVASVGDTIKGAHHFGYLGLSAGIEYHPFDFGNGISPFIGASVSPTYYYSLHRVVADLYVLDYLKGTFLAMTYLEAGVYYELNRNMDIRFSVTGGYNLIPNWKHFVLLQSRLGVRYFF